MTTLKIQYMLHERGEFAEKQTVDYSSFIDRFNKEANDVVQFKYSWTINHNLIKYGLNNNETYYLLIEHIARDAYRVTYGDIYHTHAYTNNLYYDSIADLVKNFFDKDYLSLIESLHKSDIKIKKLIEIYTELDFTYIAQKEIFDLIIVAAFFIMGICILSAAVHVLTIIPSLILFALSFLILRIYLNHLKESKNKAITISPGGEDIQVVIDNVTHQFLKSDIALMRSIYTYDGRNPFGSYEYTQLVLKNKSIVNIPAMILHPMLMNYNIRNVPKEKRTVFYAYIKWPTIFTSSN